MQPTRPLSKFQAQFLAQTRRYADGLRMLPTGGRVLACVSGGADSVCLLLSLLALAPQRKLTVLAAHVNHCLRGAASDADEQFVRRLCERLEVPLCVRRVDVAAQAAERGMSVEAAAHDVRYDYFLELEQKLDLQKIATAHTANDNAESVLAHMLRGAGTDGMAGIAPVRDSFVRPLLWAQRAQVEQYLSDAGESYVTDETNLAPVCTRNKIRLGLLPYLEEHFNPSIVRTLCQDSALAAADAAYLNELAEAAAEDILYRGGEGKVVLDGPKLAAQPAAIAARLVRIAARCAAGGDSSRTVAGSEAVARALGLMQSGHPSGSAPLGCGLQARRQGYNLIVERVTPRQKRPEPISPVEVPLGGSVSVAALGVRVSASVEEADASAFAGRLKNKKDTAYFDYNLIKGKIYIRNRTPGDVFSPFGMDGRKKLSDLFIDEKVDQGSRSRVPLLCDDGGSRILWVCGLRRSNAAPVTERTRRILKVIVQPDDSASP